MFDLVNDLTPYTDAARGAGDAGTDNVRAAVEPVVHPLHTITSTVSSLRTVVTQNPVTTAKQIGNAQLDEWVDAVESESRSYAIGYFASDVTQMAVAVAVPSIGLKRFTRLLGRLCSFSATTLVLMADGSTKPISEIVPGDWVWAQDPETGERGPRQVTHLWVHEDMVVDLEIGGHDVATTENHPFWNETDSEWQRSDELDSGDFVLAAGGGLLSVDGLVRGSERRATAFNLTVSGTHTYFVAVGEMHVLVHNTCGLPSPAEAANLIRSATPTGRALVDDVIHRSAPWAVDDVASNGSVFRIVGGDGVERTLVQVPGELDGTVGRFEWIVEDGLSLTHQRFVSGGSINGIPNRK